MKKLLAVLLATSMTTMVALPPAFAQSASAVPAEQQGAAAELSAAVANQDEGRIVAAVAALASSVSGLSGDALDSALIAIALDLESSVQAQASDAPVRSYAAAAVTALAQFEGVSGTATEELAAISARILGSASAVTLGAVAAPPAAAAPVGGGGGGGGGGQDPNGSPTAL